MDYGANANAIFEIEREITGLLDSELKETLLNLKKFAILNQEKLTPHFVNLVKKTKPDANVDEICSGAGPFTDSSERSKYIANFYRSLYKKGAELEPESSIENFLEEVKNHPVALSAKLTEAEKTDLDAELTLNELDRALETCNMAASPGLDGLSNHFIKEFWPYLRNPLLKYANCCKAKGRLTDSFRRAKIRLIPKKGDTSKINNWCPISLLNCLYKILSRTFASRLS
jgi:hypothetical protein